MKQAKVRWLCALVVGVVCWSAKIESTSFAQGASELVVVVNKGNPVTAISKNDAKKMMLGEVNNWPGGAKVVVVLGAAGSGDRSAALKKVCGMSESEYTRHQLQASFTGKTAASVRDAPTPAAVKAFIKSNPGAMGFLHKSDVDADVKVALTLE